MHGRAGEEMKLNQEMINWIEKHDRLIHELMVAERVVQFGKVVLKYQDGRYLGMDLHPTMKIDEITETGLPNKNNSRKKPS